jgi:protein involved in polysaccharide export with SLBB domain
MKLSQLIQKADGLKEDAFMSRGYITRLKIDNQTQIISFDVAAIISGKTLDISLQREDIISISSIFDLKEEYKVSIDGEVREPGEFDYAQNMTLEELIIQAGGFSESASPQRVEISRRVKSSDQNSEQAKTAEVFQINIEKDLNLSVPKFELQPFDIVSVRSSIGYEIQRQVKIEGEVLYPGMYTISNKNERVSDLVERAGGLTALAYTKGASLKREGVTKVRGLDKNDAKAQAQLAEEEKSKLNKLQRLQENAMDSTATIKDEEVLKNAEAAIDAVDNLGYINRKKVAIGGHSYGAFMTANLLTHSNLFACGIARSGAYNRTLTPFGFQSEQRNYWDVPEVYNTMSPFMNADKMKTPMLLVHGDADNNPGTFTLQTERYFQALKNLGAPVRMVLLPKESHGYAAKDNIFHLLWEQEQFLDKYLKN